MDVFDKCSQFNTAREMQAAGLYPYFLPLDDTEGTEVTIEGRKVLMIGSNNYLGLTTDPRVWDAAVEAVRRFGTSCTGSRFLNGTLTLHKELEERLANFLGKQAAVVFSTGYQVNLGVIAGDENVIHFIQHHARSLIFSGSMPASNVAAVLAALEIMETEPDRIERLWPMSECMRAGLTEMGCDTGVSVTPIIPIKIGPMEKTFLAWKLCLETGLYTNAVVSPAVPPDQCPLRTSYMAAHTEEQVDRALNILGEVGRELELID